MAFIPVAGYFGACFGGPYTGAAPSVPLFMNRWNLTISVNKLSYDTFHKTPSLYYFETSIPGLASADADINGYWNDDAAARLTGNNILIRPGSFISLYLGHTPTAGYLLNGYVNKISPGVSANGTNDFNWNLTVLNLFSFTQ